MRGLGSLALATALIVTLVAWPFGGSEPSPRHVRFVRGGSLVAERETSALRELPATRLDRLIGRLARDRRIRRGRADFVLRADRRIGRRQLDRTLESGSGTVVIPEAAAASRIRVPLVEQALRNNCETAALAMLLAARGKHADQLMLQRRLARSGPLDPRTDPDGTLLWGDPAEGFVGRPDGGGPAGGYGVYEGPIKRLAGRYGVDLTDLTGKSAGRIYRTLLKGRPVMAWVGLSDGPYRTWKTPRRRSVTGNFGEHTVVLTGTRDRDVTVNDPLSGRRIRWTRADFELMWKRLDRRALSL